MLVEIDGVCLANVWEESFNDRETGQPVNLNKHLNYLLQIRFFRFLPRCHHFQTF